MAKTIKMSLSTESIEQALRELETYQRDFERKVNEFQERLAEEIMLRAQNGYDSALGGTVSTSYGGAEMFEPIKISVTCEHSDSFSVVIASGEEVAFVEFGAGVFFNGSAGSSPHPKGQELGMTIGSYGLGNGKKTMWAYRDDAGTLVFTRGTPASQSLYNATIEVAELAQNIAREVFQ